jgi:HK97 family phage portal protein
MALLPFKGRRERPRAPAPEETKASQAKPFIALHSQGRAVWTPRSYEALAREGYAGNPVVFRCVRMIAEAAAATPLRAKAGGRVETEHPLLDLLAAPNPHQSGAELLEAVYGHLQVSGNAYIEQVELNRRPRELYALRPDRVKVIPGPTGWPDGYEYTVNGKRMRFMADAQTGRMPVLHLRQFHPVNDHYGMSPLEAAASSVDVHNAGQAWNKALLDNAARPSGALVYTGPDGAGTLTDEQFDRLKAQFSDEYTGAGAAGRPLVLEGGLDWKPMSHSPADMDFLDAKHAAAREIALAFGVPPMLLGIPGDNTYSNYKEAQLAFWRGTVLPLVDKAVGRLTTWLGPAFGAVKLEADRDRVTALSAEREALWARVERASFLSDDEKRRAVGLEPLGRPASPASDPQRQGG